MNSLRMSFWIVPDSIACGHALLLARDDEDGQDRDHRAVHRHRDRHLSSGMPSNRIFMSSTLSIATPALPTSPTTRG